MHIVEKHVMNFIPSSLLTKLFGGSTCDRGQRPNISNLPPELIGYILKELNWRDVLTVRCVCKALYGATKAKDLWRTILAQYLSTTRPKPHLFLRDPSELSTDELEGVLGQLDSGWDISCFSSLKTIDVPFERPGTITTVFYLPGGHWKLEGHNDGSIWYRNLRSNRTLASKDLLIPIPFDDTQAGRHYQVTTLLTVDLPQTLLESSPGSTRLHPPFTHFNLAVFTTHSEPLADDPNTRRIVEIWRVEVQNDGDKLVPSKRLASFREEIGPQIMCCSLFGSSIAYCMETRTRRDIFIVEWTSISETAAQDMQYCRAIIPRQLAKLLWLLPNARLLVAHISQTTTLALWDLSTCPMSNTIPSRLQDDEIQRQPVRLWSYKRKANIARTLYPHLWYLPGSTRLVLPTTREVIGLIIYDENQASEGDASGDHWVDVVALLRDLGKGTDTVHSSQGFGYRRGAIIDLHGVFNLVRYSWPDDPPDMKVDTDCTLVVSSGVDRVRELYLDELAGRFVFAGASIKKYWIVDFP